MRQQHSVSMLFHKKTPEVATDEELRSMLESIDVLVELAASKKRR